MLSTNSTNYGNILLTEEEFENRYDKHSVYNPENCEDLINCCEARALETSDKANKVARELPNSECSVKIALRIKTEEHQCCSEDLMALRESEQQGWKEAAIAWEVCRSIHERFAKKKDALYSTRHADFEKHANDARQKIIKQKQELETNKAARALKSLEDNKIESSEQEIEANISWVRRCLGYNVDSEEALEIYNIYKNYREEGQTIEVSKQYAGLL